MKKDGLRSSVLCSSGCLGIVDLSQQNIVIVDNDEFTISVCNKCGRAHFYDGRPLLNEKGEVVYMDGDLVVFRCA